MNRTGKLLLIFGFCIALFSGFGVFVLLTLAQPKPAAVETTKLVIAFQNIAPRAEIATNQVGAADWPRAIGRARRCACQLASVRRSPAGCRRASPAASLPAVSAARGCPVARGI